MQTKSTSYGKKLLALMLSLLMLVSVLPVSAWATADAKPEKITLVGSSDALEYEFVDYLTFAWEDIPHYKVTVPAGTKKVQLYGTVYLDKAGSSGSGYTKEDGLNDWPAPVDYWSADQVGSSAPYTIETRTSGYEKNLSLVKTRSYADTSSAYILEFVEKDDSPAAPAPVLTADLSTAAVTYTCGDTANALAVQATGSGTLSYQWQVSTTSAADGFKDITDATQSSYTLHRGTGQFLVPCGGHQHRGGQQAHQCHQRRGSRDGQRSGGDAPGEDHHLPGPGYRHDPDPEGCCGPARIHPRRHQRRLQRI